MDSGELLSEGSAHSGHVRSLAFSPDDRQLVRGPPLQLLLWLGQVPVDSAAGLKRDAHDETGVGRRGW